MVILDGRPAQTYRKYETAFCENQYLIEGSVSSAPAVRILREEPIRMTRNLLAGLAAIDERTGEVNAVIETPGGSRNKFKYDPKDEVMRFGKSLPAGAVFPHEFGFIPSTRGEDGDPLDVMLLMDDPTYPGIVVTARLIGVIEAEQREGGKVTRNDRLIGVAVKCQDFQSVKALDDLNPNLLTQIEHFFVSYNQMEGKEFKPLGRADAEQARRLIEEGRRRFAAGPSE